MNTKRIRQLKARMQCYGLVAWITIKLIAIGLHGLWKAVRHSRTANRGQRQ